MSNTDLTLEQVAANADRLIERLRADRQEHLGLPVLLNCWQIPETDLVINFTDHLFHPFCGLCHRQCENKWGNNGAPLTDDRICNKCNDRVIHNRIMCIVDSCGPNNGLDDDCPDDP